MNNPHLHHEDLRVVTLAEALPRAQARVRALIPMYREIGNAGVFALAMMELSLRRADQASAAGDVVAMIRALEDLRGYKE